MTNNTTNFNVLDQLRSRFLMVELSGRTGIRASVRYDEGKHIIQSNKGGDDSAYSVSQKLYPKGYDEAIKDLRSAYNQVRTHFYANTMPFQHNASGNSQGKRLVSNDQTLRGQFMAEHQRLIDELDRQRERFAGLINHIVNRIEANDALGSDFDRDNYPSPAEIRASYMYEPIVPMPIPGTESVDGIPVPPEMAQEMTDAMQAQAQAEYRFGVQSQARETLEYVQTMATNLSRMVEWHNSDPERRQKRQPAVYDSLFQNVEHAASKLRQFAVPETQEGSAMLELADRIERTLRPGDISADEVKSDLSTAEQQAQRARDAAQAIEDCGLLD